VRNVGYAVRAESPVGSVYAIEKTLLRNNASSLRGSMLLQSEKHTNTYVYAFLCLYLRKVTKTRRIAALGRFL